MLLAFVCLSVHAINAAPAVELRGIDFQGGGQASFGANFYGRENVNMAYAHPTGVASALTATFKFKTAPEGQSVLWLEAMSDDSPTNCRIRIALNDHELFSGTNNFMRGQWRAMSFPIPAGVLRKGDNQLVIANLEPAGGPGQPPWFMVACAAIVGTNDHFHFAAIKSHDLKVDLPSEPRSFPEPLAGGHAEPGFKLRGIKGWAWTPEQYLEEIPYLKRFKMNFLMNCYLSMFTSPTNHDGSWINEWWKPLPDWKKAAYSRVIRECARNDITFCFAIHPQLGSSRPFSFDRPGDVDDLYQNFAWAQSEGVHWFSLSLDDVDWKGSGPIAGGRHHAQLVNTVIGRLREKDPGAQLIFCPGPYSGDGSRPEDRAYLQALGKDLDPAIYIFWTGDDVAPGHITRLAAEKYKSVVGHRLFLWDNYPVNDSAQTLHLGPVRGRAADLGDVADGYLSNPMARENEINRLPLATCADYAYNPWDYDPARSIGQAIFLLATNAPQRAVLQELVETYPGFLVTGGGTGTNPVRQKFDQFIASGNRDQAREWLQHISEISSRMKAQFPGEFNEAQRTVGADVVWMKAKL